MRGHMKVRTAQGELSEAELNVARTRELLSQASDQQRRTQIIRPIGGLVKNLRAATIGGGVQPGDPIMEIVPLHERLQIDAKLNPMDRGYVQVGQHATVKLSAYDYTTYGGLEGKVILVAPDTTMGPDNQPFYRVVVQTERAYLGDDESKRPITAGMQATVDIHTGTRTVMAAGTWSLPGGEVAHPVNRSRISCSRSAFSASVKSTPRGLSRPVRLPSSSSRFGSPSRTQAVSRPG